MEIRYSFEWKEVCRKRRRRRRRRNDFNRSYFSYNRGDMFLWYLFGSTLAMQHLNPPIWTYNPRLKFLQNV
jgi:hypothetical protein